MEVVTNPDSDPSMKRDANKIISFWINQHLLSLISAGIEVAFHVSL